MNAQRVGTGSRTGGRITRASRRIFSVRLPLAVVLILAARLTLVGGSARAESGGNAGTTPADGVSAAAVNSDYLVGPEDVLSVSVWEHPELSRTVAVRTDGHITFPPLGEIEAVGRTTANLSRDLEGQIYNTLRLTTQVTVTVVAFNSQKIYLAGQVASPGKYAFETIPSLVDLLGMTGGINPQADLTQVRILRRGDSGNTTLSVDLSRAVQTGDLGGVPALQSGDLVMVPGASASTGGMGTSAAVYVLGEVGRPGPYNAVAGMDLMQLLAIAGGLTQRGDMSQIDVITPGSGGSGCRVRVDLAREIRSGRGGLVMRAGDTVFVPSKSTAAVAVAWGVVRETLGISRDVVNLVLIKNVVRP